MPDSPMIYKAGKLSFLLVCLFLCTACKQEKMEFTAGVNSVMAVEEERTVEIEDTSENLPVEEKEIQESQPVNINTANEQELMTLPGIGEVKAAAIIEHRQREGEFEKIEDIMNVKGIGTGIFSNINSLICVK